MRCQDSTISRRWCCRGDISGARAKGLERQRGSVSVMVALSMVFLLGVAAFAIDFAHLFVVRNELQNAADAAALAGAPCLYQRNACGNLSATAPDWTTASQQATTAIGLNASNNAVLTNGVVTSGYWNLTGTPNGLQSLPYKPGANDLPAVRVVISKTAGKNGGPVSTFLAGILGVNSMPVSAQAVAVVSQPGYVGPGGLFPVAMSQCLYNTYWDSTNNKPKTATSTSPISTDLPLPQVVGQPYTFAITSSYHAGPCEAGQWSSFDSASNNVTYLQQLISSGNPASLAIGASPGTYMVPGTKTTLYSAVNACSAAGNKSCEYVVVPVVSSLATGMFQPIVAFACLHIQAAVGGSQKYIQVQMSNNPDKCQAPGGSGIGPSYGALTPPHLVQ